MKHIFASADYGLLGLLLFFCFFLCAVFWTMRPSAKRRYDRFADIPLKEETND